MKKGINFSEGIFFVLRRRAVAEELAFARFICPRGKDLPRYFGNGNNVVSAFVGIAYVNCAGILQEEVEAVEKVEAEVSVFSVQLVIKPKFKCRICLGWVDSQRPNEDVRHQFWYERSRVAVTSLKDIVIPFAWVSEVRDCHRYGEWFHRQFTMDYGIADTIVF